MKVQGSPTIPVDAKSIAEELCKDLGKEDLWWESSNTMSDEAIYAGLGIPYHTGGPVESPNDDVPIWVTSEYLVSKETMQHYADQLKKINNTEKKEQGI